MKRMLFVLPMVIVTLIFSGCGLFKTYNVYTGKVTTNTAYDSYSYWEYEYTESEALSFMNNHSGGRERSWTADDIYNYLETNGGFSRSTANSVGYRLKESDYALLWFTGSSNFTRYFILKY